VAGLAGAAVLTLGSAVLSTLWNRVPFVPTNIAQAAVRVTSGKVNSFFIDRLGHWAQRLALLGVCAGFVLAGLVAGVVVRSLAKGEPTRSGWWIPSLLPLWVVSAGAYVRYPQSLSRVPFAAATLPLYLLGGFAASRAYRRIEDGARAPATTDVTRRTFLRSFALGGLGVALGVADLGRLIYRRPDPGRERLVVPSLTPVPGRVLTPGDAAFDRVPGLTPEATSTARHYVVDEELIDPDIDPATWRLTVGGLVDRPLRLSYEQLKGFPVIERYQTLECISNRIGGNLISTAKWAGVPVRLILERAGVKPGAVEIVFRAAGGFSDSLGLEQAMDPSTLLAIGMNGMVLPRAHGFPARLLSVDTYGMKNPKWLTEIEVVDQPYQGFWEQRGWSKRAIVRTGSRMDVPLEGAQVAPPVTVAGIAFAGARGISKVEVSPDDSLTWYPAQLRSPLSPYTWQQWLYRWAPSGDGNARLLVRAYDGDGVVQSDALTDTFPNGVSGLDGATISY
jgi:DMSO/TMAO reductase YedYZ molybdopterin-dependent catalytic subunit